MRSIAAAFFTIVFVSACASTPGTPPAEAPATRAKTITQWKVEASPMLDAALLVGVLSGDALQQPIYEAEIARFSALLSPDAARAIAQIGAYYDADGAGLAGPNFAYYLAALLPADLDGAIGALADPSAIAAAAGATPDEAKEFLETAQDLRVALIALRDAGFEAHYAETVQPKLDAAVAALARDLSGYDIIPEQERLLGRPLDPALSVLVLEYNEPYGIRVAGQRFAAHWTWSYLTTLRVAAHEVFHPPFDLGDEEVWEAARHLETSPYMRSLLAKRDRKWGYDDFEAFLNEDSTQALDKIVAVRMGFAKDPAEYWRTQDDGMHILAAALFQAMNETGFADRGGRYRDWLVGAFQERLLTGSEVQRRAALIVGEEAVEKWAPAD